MGLMAAPGKLEYTEKKEARLRWEPWSTPTFDGQRGFSKHQRQLRRNGGHTQRHMFMEYHRKAVFKKDDVRSYQMVLQRWNKVKTDGTTGLH